MQKNDPIYIAGHRGLVGSSIYRRLQQEGFTNLITRTRAELDLLDQRAVADFFDRTSPKYVFLAAAKVGGIHANATLPAEFIYENLMIQTNLMHQSHRHGVQSLLFLGSSCIYPKHAPQPMREEHLLTGPLEPTNSAYAVAKIAGIEMCRAYNRQYHTRFLPVMPTNLYGPQDNFDLQHSHVLPAMIRKFHLAKLAAAGDREAMEQDERRFGPIPAELKEALGYPDRLQTGLPPRVVLWGSGTPRREFLHVDDLADACVHLMQAHNGTELINIGVGEDITICRLAELVQRIVGFQGEVVFDPAKPDGTPRKLLDVSKLRQAGWQARISLERGIRETYHWYCREGKRRVE